MSVLKQKLQKASNEFQSHNFKKSLQLYEDCLTFCYRTDESKSVINNIMSTKGALQCILGNLDDALSTLNEVLKAEPNHYLCLMRRSQVYKKKGKFKKALNDLEETSVFAPDSLQIAALKIEIESLISKNKNVEQISDESSDEQEIDEVGQLNFSNLKKIDRKSCSIMVPQIGRKSRVTISGDTAFIYQIDEEENCNKSNSTAISQDAAKEKYVKTFREIQLDDTDSIILNQKPIPLVVKSNTRSKSILKNKNTSIFVEQTPIEKKEKYGGRESKLVEKLKNIDGKVLSSNNDIFEMDSKQGSNKSLKKEVEFRKSIFSSQQKPFTPILILESKGIKKPAGRKSCLKRSSFSDLEEQIKEKNPVRKSKFEMMSRQSIDGIVIKNRKSIELKKADKENVKAQGSENDSEGSQYNIYGSNQLLLSKQIRQSLGFDKEEKQKQEKPQQKPARGKSILKRSSLLETQNKTKKTLQVIELKPAIEEKVVEQIVDKEQRKGKKSVMFTKSRFAE